MGLSNSFFSSNNNNINNNNRNSDNRNDSFFVLVTHCSAYSNLIIAKLPKEIWRFHIFKYFTKKELGFLRLCCKWMKGMIDELVWKQWIPYEYLLSYQFSLVNLGWKLPKECGCYVTSPLINPPEVPEWIKEIDFSTSTLSFSNLRILSRSVRTLSLKTIEVKDLNFIQENFPQVKIIIRGYRLESSPFFWACAKDYSNIVEWCILHNEDINQLNPQYGETPLFIAVLNGRKQIVSYLLEKGANPNIPRRDTGMTPLILSFVIPYFDSEIVDLLLNYGSDLEFRDNAGRNVFDYAQIRGDYYYKFLTHRKFKAL